MRCRVIGTSPARDDAWAKATGTAKYVDDLDLDTYCIKAYRSTISHALVKEIDVSKAQRFPGVKAVLTYKDIPGIREVGPMIKDQPVLVKDKIRTTGETLALLIGEEKAITEATSLISVKLEELPAIYDVEDAIKPDTVLVHEKGNVITTRIIKKGDIDAILRRAPVVIENCYTTQMVEHAYLEPDAAIACWKGGVLNIYATTQHPHQDLQWLSKVLNLDTDRIRVRQMVTGGGFGGKIDSHIILYAGLAAWKIGLPVRMVFDRQEVFKGTTKRHPFKIWYTTAATDEGKLLGIKVKILADTGAYCNDGLAVAGRAAVHACGPYRVPNAYVEASTVYTNNTCAAAMRGYGCPQITFAIESQMDLLASHIDIDPIELRMKNCLQVGDETITGQKLYHSVSIGETLKHAKRFYHAKY